METPYYTSNTILNILFTVIFTFLAGFYSIPYAQPVIEAAVSPDGSNPGDIVSVTISVSDPVDAFFFASRVTFNPDDLEFIELEEAGILAGLNTLTFYNNYSTSEIGISITRTEPLSTNSAGELAVIRFRVRPLASAGNTSVQFSELQLSDSNGTDIPIQEPDDVNVNINVAIGDAALIMPASVTIQDGESFEATGRVFASTITDGEDEITNLTVWAGVNTSNTDPSGWNESVWEEMDFDSKDPDGFAVYRRDIGFMRPQGDYYIAIRAQLDGAEFVFGGRSDTGGGIWDGTENVSAFFSVTEPDAFRYIIANWDFDDNVNTPSIAVPANESVEIEIVGASRSGSNGGFSSGGANSNGWNPEEGVEKYWLLKVSTESFEELQLSSRQVSSGTGPRDFQIQISTDSLNWTNVPGGTIELTTSTASGVVQNLELPELANDLEVLFIRWLNSSPYRINTDSLGNFEETGSSGTSRIDDILITGTNLNRIETTIWPGDTNDSGSVTEADVLPLGLNWRQRGPKPLFPTFEWAPRRVEKWVTDTPDNLVTASDANGDGIVNERDLQVIGLNFGKEQGPPPSGGFADKQNPDYDFILSPLEAGETVRFIVSADKRVDLIGSSFRVNMTGVDEKLWDLVTIEPLSWADNWKKENRILSFEMVKKENGHISGAFVHKGVTVNRSGIDLIAFEIRATGNWPQSMNIRLANTTIIDNAGKTTQIDNAILKPLETVSIDQPFSELPQKTQLLSNYPNPFNPSTIIRYELAQASNVSLTVYDVIGRKVAVLINNEQISAGRHEIRFDAAGLASGLYLYRLQADNFIQSRSMMLIK
ncbi:MAG: T9SS type A sorting domain-containing protein [Balneolaceae bacterium]